MEKNEGSSVYLTPPPPPPLPPQPPLPPAQSLPPEPPSTPPPPQLPWQVQRQAIDKYEQGHKLPYRLWPFLAAWIDSYDIPLPESLISKCKPLFCELCSAKLNSSDQARLHYNGKIHDKHARHFLQTWSCENKCPMPQRKTTIQSKSKDEKKVDKASLTPGSLHCSVCDIYFTSAIHADQHYQGRNHQRKSKGLSTFHTGYFNQVTGKWQRHPPSESDAKTLVVANETIDNQVNEQKSPDNPLFCSLCKVGATSQSQFDMHLNGKQHKSKLRRQTECGQGNADVKAESQDEVTTVTDMDPTKAKATLVAQKLKSDVQKRDYSAFRTPSGQYYCSICTLCVNSELQFIQHIESKKHKMKRSKSSSCVMAKRQKL